MTTIRSYDPARSGDIQAITKIYGHHVQHGTASFETDPPSRTEMTRRIAPLLDGSYPVLVAEQDNVVIGYAYAGPHNPRHGYRLTVEDSIYVHHKAMGRGIGHRLLAAVITAAQANGYHQMMAVIGDSANTASVALHHAHGFQHIGTARRIGFKFGRFLDVVFMQCTLNEDEPETI
jgi:L-amino acid N-acyltransferase YncA